MATIVTIVAIVLLGLGEWYVYRLPTKPEDD